MATVGLLIAIPALDHLAQRPAREHRSGSSSRGVATSPRSGCLPASGRRPKVDWKLPVRRPVRLQPARGLRHRGGRGRRALAAPASHDAGPPDARRRRPTADLASTRGINERTTSRYAWVIGMMLAALAGVVGAPIIGSLAPGGLHRRHVRRRRRRGARRAAIHPARVPRWAAARRRREPRRRLRRLRQGHQRLQQLGAVHPPAGRSRGHGPRPKPPGWFGRRGDTATRLPGRPALVAPGAPLDAARSRS